MPQLLLQCSVEEMAESGREKMCYSRPTSHKANPILTPKLKSACEYDASTKKKKCIKDQEEDGVPPDGGVFGSVVRNKLLEECTKTEIEIEVRMYSVSRPPCNCRSIPLYVSVKLYTTHLLLHLKNVYTVYLLIFQTAKNGNCPGIIGTDFYRACEVSGIIRKASSCMRAS